MKKLVVAGMLCLGGRGRGEPVGECRRRFSGWQIGGKPLQIGSRSAPVVKRAGLAALKFASSSLKSSCAS